MGRTHTGQLLILLADMFGPDLSHAAHVNFIVEQSTAQDCPKGSEHCVEIAWRERLRREESRRRKAGQTPPVPKTNTASYRYQIVAVVGEKHFVFVPSYRAHDTYKY